MHSPNSAKTTLRSPRGLFEMSVAAGLTIAGVFLVLVDPPVPVLAQVAACRSMS